MRITKNMKFLIPDAHNNRFSILFITGTTFGLQEMQTITRQIPAQVIYMALAGWFSASLELMSLQV
jgi:hypothetical protein